MQKLVVLFFIIICLPTINCFSQTWDLKNCNPDSIPYPIENGRGSKRFPEGSCPPVMKQIIPIHQLCDLATTGLILLL